MGKIIALYALLLVGNAAFLIWVYRTRNRPGSKTGPKEGRGTRDPVLPSNETRAPSDSGSPSDARKSGSPDDCPASTAGEFPDGGTATHYRDGRKRSRPIRKVPVDAESGTAGGDVVYHDSPDKPEKNEADTEPPAPAPVWTRPEGPFMVPPMVQIGTDASRFDCVEIMFFAHTENHGFTVKAFSDRQLAVSEPVETPICLEGVPPHRRYSYTVSGLKSGEKFKYWVIFGGKVVFEAESRARMTEMTAHRVVIVGDTGNGSVESTRIAHRIYADYKPDLLSITGDVVYMHGRASEYLRRFLPVYNARTADPGVGAPLLSQVLSFTSLGNHCVGKTEYFLTPLIDDFPDLHAYFMYWSLPLNGPLVDPRAPKNIPELRGSEDRIKRFLNVAGERFPRMGNYSFDDGGVHWLVLDANAYMDWTMKELRDFVENDLIAAQSARWRFVNFHQPGFSSNPKHGQEKRMRLLADLFQKYNVHLVFNGHCHYYERSFPLKFTVDVQPDGSVIDKDGYVGGTFALDKTFDGKTVTKPDGVIYITTGAGGAKLDPSGIHWRKEDWKPFTDKLIGDRHSFTVCDVEEDKLTLRQIDMKGEEIDRFVITR
jgi:hypothetical protein